MRKSSEFNNHNHEAEEFLTFVEQLRRGSKLTLQEAGELAELFKIGNRLELSPLEQQRFEELKQKYLKGQAEKIRETDPTKHKNK